MTSLTPHQPQSGTRWPGLIDRYRRFLPVSDQTPIVTLNEGNTPLINSVRLHARLGESVKLLFKFEGANPTGSFKDRGMTLAVSKAREAGAEAVICASTGNTSASMAAYAARAGLRSYMLIPHGYVALGKLAQGLHYGTEVIAIKGNFDDALTIVRALADEYPVTLVNSVNPYRLEGQKTAAFEVVDQLGDAPDVLAIPVGNAGNISAYWRGFKEYQGEGLATRLPVMLGFQAEGAAPLVYNRVFERPDTVATAIRIGNPASWQLAVEAMKESSGGVAAVTDAEILEAYRMLAREEGIFCEPASAASVAGLIKRAQAEPFAPGTTIVAVLTGNGLKDPETAIRLNQQELEPASADAGAIAQMLGF